MNVFARLIDGLKGRRVEIEEKPVIDVISYLRGLGSLRFKAAGYDMSPSSVFKALTMQSHLKVKIKSLAAEAAIIRFQEQRTLERRDWVRNRQGPNDVEQHLTSEYESLRLHRVNVVRTEARASLLAYSFLRGKTYAETEMAGSVSFDLNHVAKICQRFGLATGTNAILTSLKQWRDAPRPQPTAEELQAIEERKAALAERRAAAAVKYAHLRRAAS